MKQIKITNIDGREWASPTFEEEQPLEITNWLNKKLMSGHWGKLERTEIDRGQLTDEDKARATSQTQVTDENGESFLQYVIPSEITVETVEEILDYKEKRKAEYDKIDELLKEATYEALVEGRSDKLDNYKILRQLIKQKYPKV